MTTEVPNNRLYFGDNLGILREHIGDESVDLIYLDPPFNSARDYNILFASPKGGRSEAQIVAFKDSWQWGMQAEGEFDEIVRGGNTDVAEMIQAMRRFLGENDMMAYLVMMARRLLELHRVLKPTGSLYLHCDPAASHYLKIVLDAIFGGNFRNEIIWKRTGAHGGARRFGPVHDTLFFYSKTERYLWNFPKITHSVDYVQKHFAQTDKDDRKFQAISLTGSGIRHGESGQPWRHVDPTLVKRHWAIPGHVSKRYSLTGQTVQERLDALDAAGLIFWPKTEAGTPRLKWYADELEGMAIPDIWADIPPIGAQSAERLGYPTQKPLALLERIIQASSHEGNAILDPFCGCGTAVHCAQKLNRRWIGIDITHLAIALIEKRLKDAFPGIAFAVHGTPRDLDGARDLAARDKYQFQWWACSLVNAQPYQGRKKGADGGIDGLIYFQDEQKAHKKIVVSVKGGGKVGVAMVRDLVGVVEREKAEIGLFVTLAPPTQAMRGEAAKAGFYPSPTLPGNFPRLQILSVEGLLEGRERPLYPDLSQGGLTFKKAPREEKTADQKPLF
ncbi:MAG: restriction endonuclease [Candidatus Accumulibacter sp.]|jgi:site-specific DNA-methyltransferase (adenine-specific)|nr:restriction endonuclease [Accumulibacter sp.]